MIYTYIYITSCRITKSRGGASRSCRSRGVGRQCTIYAAASRSSDVPLRRPRGTPRLLNAFGMDGWKEGGSGHAPFGRVGPTLGSPAGASLRAPDACHLKH